MSRVYIYQSEQRYFAQIAAGLEELGREELTALGADEVRDGYRGFHFHADIATLYRINYGARLLARVLAPLVSFRCHHEDYLYRKAREIDWSGFLRPDQTFAVFANVSDSKVTHSRYAALRIKDAIVDHMRDRHGERPSVDTRSPHLWVHLHLARNQAILSVDTSVGALHRRGYRRETVEAPMLETLAAAIIDFSGWDGGCPLYDPMCGSGTLLAEAWIKALQIPPGRLRSRFGFESLPEFDPRQWATIQREADRAIKTELAGPETSDLGASAGRASGLRASGRQVSSHKPAGRRAPLVSGSDLDGRALHAARTNLDRLPHGSRIPLEQRDFRAIESLQGRTIVCNPPYGIRLRKGEDLSGFYMELGDFLKQRCQGSEAYIYFGEREMIKRIGLRPSWKKPLRNGGLDGRLAKYELF